MKITVNREVFLKSLTTAMLGMGSSSLPAWQCLRLEVEGKKMNIYARNSELQVQSFCKALKSDEDYAFCVPGKLFYDTIKSLTSEEVSIKTDIKGKAFVTTIWIKGNKKKFTMTGIDPGHFTPFYSKKDMSYTKMVMKPLAEAVRIASRAVSNDIKRLNLGGVNIRCMDSKIHINATTHVCGVKLVIDSEGDMPDMLITKGTASVLQSLDEVPEIHVGSNGDHVTFDTGQAVITSTLSAYKFPDMKPFWNKQEDAYILIERKEMLSSIARLAMYSVKGEDDNVCLKISGDTMTLTSESKLYGNDGHEEMDIENNDFDDLTIAFAPKALTLALSSMNADYVKFHGTTPTAHSFMFEKEASNPEHSWLLMPVYLLPHGQ